MNGIACKHIPTLSIDDIRPSLGGNDNLKELHQEKILLSDENVGILRALYALISAYNHLSELQNEVTATSKSDNHISANICAFQIQKFFVMY